MIVQPGAKDGVGEVGMPSIECAEMSAKCQKWTCQLLRLYVDLLLNNNR